MRADPIIDEYAQRIKKGDECSIRADPIINEYAQRI